MAGVVIKCQAVAAAEKLGWAEVTVSGLLRRMEKDRPSWQATIAADVLRIAGDHAQA